MEDLFPFLETSKCPHPLHPLHPLHPPIGVQNLQGGRDEGLFSYPDKAEGDKPKRGILKKKSMFDTTTTSNIKIKSSPVVSFSEQMKSRSSQYKDVPVIAIPQYLDSSTELEGNFIDLYGPPENRVDTTPKGGSISQVRGGIDMGEGKPHPVEEYSHPIFPEPKESLAVRSPKLYKVGTVFHFSNDHNEEFAAYSCKYPIYIAGRWYLSPEHYYLSFEYPSYYNVIAKEKDLGVLDNTLQSVARNIEPGNVAIYVYNGNLYKYMQDGESLKALQNIEEKSIVYDSETNLDWGINASYCIIWV